MYICNFRQDPWSLGHFSTKAQTWILQEPLDLRLRTSVLYSSCIRHHKFFKNKLCSSDNQDRLSSEVLAKCGEKFTHPFACPSPMICVPGSDTHDQIQKSHIRNGSSTWRSKVETSEAPRQNRHHCGSYDTRHSWNLQMTTFKGAGTEWTDTGPPFNSFLNRKTPAQCLA